MSGGGVHESHDGGGSFAPLLKGLEVVEGFDVADPTFHDPHCVRFAGSNPDRLYQQNHCGLYRLDRPSADWTDLGSWQAVWQESPQDAAGNALSAQAMAIDCEGSLLRSESSDIAVVGIGLRFPGDATSPEAFQEFLLRGRSALSTVLRRSR